MNVLRDAKIYTDIRKLTYAKAYGLHDIYFLLTHHRV